jgi:hypothetical protein
MCLWACMARILLGLGRWSRLVHAGAVAIGQGAQAGAGPVGLWLVAVVVGGAVAFAFSAIGRLTGRQLRLAPLPMARAGGEAKRNHRPCVAAYHRVLRSRRR